MPVPKSITLTNFNKGLVTDRPDISLAAGEFSELDNWYLQAGKMRSRPPIEIFPLRTGSTWGFGNVKGFQMVGDTPVLIRTGALTSFNSTSGQCTDLSSGVLTFLPLGQPARPWISMCATASGNIYAAGEADSIYMQTAGAGNFVDLAQTARSWHGMCATPGGNVYACVYGGDIYKQTAGAGAFTAIGGTSRNWSGMAAAPNGNVYACVASGDIYMQTAGVGAFVALGGTSRAWSGMCAAPNGNIYATVQLGDIYMQTAGVGAFAALGQTSRVWQDCAADSSGNIYACVDTGSIYKRVAGAGNFIDTGQVHRRWYGMCCSGTIAYACVTSGDIYNTAVSFPSGEKPQSVQYNGFGYAAIGNGLLKFNSTNYYSLGIAPPPSAPTIADGAAGTVEAGTMYAIYTFVDADGKESGPSPVSASLVHTVNTKVAWTGVAVALDARVIARNLYRTLPNQTGEYFYVGQIADNTSTTVSEDTTIVSMGDLADIYKGRYQDLSTGGEAIDIATVFERLWVTDGSFVYGSLPEDPEYFDSENVYAFSPDDGENIKAVEALPGMLVVLKEGSVWALDQSLGFFEFLPRLVDNSAGCAFTQSAASSGKLVFFASKNAIFMCDGRSPAVDISTGRIDLKNKLGAGAAGCVFRKRGWYILYSIGEGGDSAIRVYDYIRNYWFTISYGKTITDGTNTAAAAAPEFFAEGLNSAGSPTIFTVMNSTTADRGTLIDLFDEEAVGGSGVADEGVGDAVNAVAVTAGYSISDAKIQSTAQFKALDWEAPGRLHTISRILISCTDPVESVTYTDANAQLLSTVSVIREDGRVAAKSRSSVDISGTRQWKNVGLSSRDRKCTQSAIKIIRNSRWPLVIEALQIHGELWDQIPAE